jgi:hypothetical protein
LLSSLLPPRIGLAGKFSDFGTVAHLIAAKRIEALPPAFWGTSIAPRSFTASWLLLLSKVLRRRKDERRAATMFAETSLQQEMGVTIIVWVSFLVVWIIMAARKNDTASPANGIPCVTKTEYRTARSGAISKPAKLCEKTLPTQNAVTPVPLASAERSESRAETLVETATHAPFEFYEWL